MLSVDDCEWWVKWHKANVEHLLHRMQQMLDGEDIDDIIRSTLKGYREAYDLPEVKE